MNRAALLLMLWLPGFSSGDAADGAAHAPAEHALAPGADCDPSEMVLLRELRQRAEALRAREAELDVREAGLIALEERVLAASDEVEAARSEVLSMLAEVAASTGPQAQQLAKMVDAMKPFDAAELLRGTEEGLAVAVLLRLQPRQAGKVLAAMEPTLAAALSTAMVRVRDPREVR
jgi:flagellar motility protein MotE (MotC chaperone)